MNEMSGMDEFVSEVRKMVSFPSIDWPPFLFHYIIVFVCVFFIMCVCVLKFKYLYWYSQPITFQFTIQRWVGSKGNTSIMNPLIINERCHNAIVYPFFHFVDHDSVTVYGTRTHSITDAPYEKIATFLSRREIVMPGRRHCVLNGGSGEGGGIIMHIPADRFEYILSQGTHGLSVFIGILTGDIKGNIKGVCILTPRIMLSFSSVKTDPPRSVSIYVCDHLAWANYITSDRESLELLETTEYIQKSREIAGEQTLYKYHEIPGFVIPFTTVYTYTFSGIGIPSSLGPGITLIQVSSTNFALFYSFVNDCVRDFRYCIFNEITQLLSLVQGGIYTIYMLLLNQVRVLAVYIFEPSWMKVRPVTRKNSKLKTKPKKTRGNRITALHDHISRTSTALVKYLPPAVHPKYDAFGKRIKHTTNPTGDNYISNEDPDILLLKSSIQHKTLCDRDVFVRGFVSAAVAAAASSIQPVSPADTIICIDTIAHNYHIIDDLTLSTTACNFISQEKWYYILYNAIIHQETLCKDILII
jgi:hypothetical protein